MHDMTISFVRASLPISRAEDPLAAFGGLLVVPAPLACQIQVVAPLRDYATRRSQSLSWSGGIFNDANGLPVHRPI
jgi:hypothetical protein